MDIIQNIHAEDCFVSTSFEVRTLDVERVQWQNLIQIQTGTQTFINTWKKGPPRQGISWTTCTIRGKNVGETMEAKRRVLKLIENTQEVGSQSSKVSYSKSSSKQATKPASKERVPQECFDSITFEVRSLDVRRIQRQWQNLIQTQTGAQTFIDISKKGPPRNGISWSTCTIRGKNMGEIMEAKRRVLELVMNPQKVDVQSSKVSYSESLTKAVSKPPGKELVPKKGKKTGGVAELKRLAREQALNSQGVSSSNSLLKPASKDRKLKLKKMPAVVVRLRVPRPAPENKSSRCYSLAEFDLKHMRQGDYHQKRKKARERRLAKSWLHARYISNKAELKVKWTEANRKGWKKNFDEKGQITIQRTQISCDTCFRTFSEQSALIGHLRRSIHNYCTASAQIPERIMTTNDNLPSTMFLYCCYKCNIHFSDLRSYKQHVDSMISCLYLCLNCGQKFRDFSGFLIHRRRQHRDEELKIHSLGSEGLGKTFVSYPELGRRGMKMKYQRNAAPVDMSFKERRPVLFKSDAKFSIVQTTKEILIGPPISHVFKTNTGLQWFLREPQEKPVKVGKKKGKTKPKKVRATKVRV